jgi:hypothetical protein
VKKSIDQAKAIRRGFDASYFGLFLITKLVVGVASQFHIGRSQMTVYGRFPNA